MRIKEIESNSEIPPVNYKAFTNSILSYPRF